MKPCSLFDTFTKKAVYANTIVEMSKILNIKEGTIGSLLRRQNIISVNDRYTKNDNKVYWTILIDFETNEEFYCIKPKSLYDQIGAEWSRKDANSFKDIKKNGGMANMGGRVFYVKDRYPTKFSSKIRNPGPKLQAILTERKVKRKISMAIRGRILKALKNRSTKKTNKTEELIGCTLDFYMGWIESKFVEGMSWDNHGKWHIDHVKPCNTFNILDVEEQKKCFHYTNCRPLWAEDNLRRPKDGKDFVLYS